MTFPPDFVDRLEAVLLERHGIHQGRGEVRFQCPFPDRHRNGDAHPSARWNRERAVWHCDVCGNGGGALELARLLGVAPSQRDRQQRAGGRGKKACENPEHSMLHETVYAIRDSDGALVAQHVRKDYRDGCKDFAWRRNGTSGLDALRVADLPLYGAEDIAAAPAGALVVLVEGEKARDALRNRGILAAGTVTGASGTPSPASLEVLRGKDVVLWPDADEAGRAHMDCIAERLVAVGIRPRWSEWGGAE